MSPEMNNEEQFDKYLSGSMSENEKKDFESKLSEDMLLQKDFQTHRELTEAIHIAALKQQLDRIHAASANTTALPAIEKKSKTRPFPVFRVSMAAAAVLLILISITSYKYFVGGNQQELYAKYYSQDPGLPSFMGASNNYTFDDAMVDYKSEEYKAAISKFTSLQQASPANDTLRYYLAMAYLGSKNYNAADILLSKLAERENIFRQKALWYHGLTLLQLKKESEATAVFATIENSPSSTYAGNATEILKTLRK